MGEMTAPRRRFGVGLAMTPELRSVLDAILALPQHQQPTIAYSVAVVEDNESLSQSLSTSPDVLLEQVQETKRKLLSSHTYMPNIPSSNVKLDVRSAIQYDALSASSTFSLEGLEPLKFLIDNSSTTSDVDKMRLYTELEVAIRATGLSFPTNNKSTPSTTKSIELEKRLQRLRMLDEERSYGKLTRNLKTHSILKDDDVTTKSMMYASSVGLNMIVAPISFGVFMYFFAGGIFQRFFDGAPDENIGRWRGTGGVDVRRVIAGVISGVFMLFVEMILFVIRSHELDAEVARKGRRRENRANPFGYTQKSMARVYVRDD